MKVRSSLKGAKKRCKNCKLIRRGRVLRVTCTNARHKVRQGS